MDSESKKIVRPIYSELQGYLSQAPTLKELNVISDNEYWYFEIGGQEFVTRYNPEEVGKVKVFNYLTLNNYNFR